MITVCVGCRKAINEDEASMCILCLAEFCDRCVLNCACLQILNQIWDAEEAAAASVVN
jgi:hypothetical protein